MGPDGYPARIWDRRTGTIDRRVAEYWREHYDLVHILRRDWAVLGPRVRGKLHSYVGEADNYFLNNAVYLAQEFLKSATNPTAMFIPRIMDQMRRGVLPVGADTVSWRY